MDKERVFERLAMARAGLLAAIEGLSTPEMTRLLVSEAWTIREILAHISGWAAWDLDTIKAIQDGIRPDLTVIRDVDTFNQGLVAERDGWSLDQILAELAETQAATEALVGSMSDRDLLESGRYQGLYWDSLAGWLQVAWEHEEEHTRQIRAWRAHAFREDGTVSTKALLQ